MLIFFCVCVHAPFCAMRVWCLVYVLWPVCLEEQNSVSLPSETNLFLFSPQISLAAALFFPPLAEIFLSQSRVTDGAT